MEDPHAKEKETDRQFIKPPVENRSSGGILVLLLSFLCFCKDLFLSIWVCISVWMYGTELEEDFLELESRGLNYLLWVLGTELWSSGSSLN